MKKFSFALSVLPLLALPLLTGTALAANWDQAALNRSSDRLIEQIDLFLAQTPNSELYRLFNADQLQQLRASAQFTPGSAPSYANLQNHKAFNDTLSQLVQNSVYGDAAIPFLALAAQNDDVKAHYNLYSSLIDLNNANVEFAYPLFQRYISQQADSKENNDYWQRFIRNYGFSLTDVEIDRTSDLPRVCLAFSQLVNPEPLQNWKQWLSVNNQPNIQWQYQGDQLCFNGEWNTDYHIQVNAKLLSEYRLSLSNQTDQNRLVNVNAATGQRTSMLRFANQGSVLNAYQQRNLTLESANLDRVQLELWQIPANNLANYDIRDLLSNPGASYYWRVDSLLRDNARQLFDGYFQVENARQNQTASNNLSFDDFFDDKQEMKAGVYLLRAKQPDDDYNSSILAFTLSNSGFTAYKTAQGLWVEMRDLDNKKPVAKQTVILYAKNNEILASAETDRNGMAFFPQAAIIGEQGAQPSHIVSANPQQFGYLNLIDSSIDLSNKGLSGELANPLMQSWIWFDRGVYRPNDTANAMFLFKTPDGKAFNSASIWATLTRPDGKTFSVTELKPHANGAYYFEQAFDSATRLGSWKLTLSLAKDGKGYLAEHPIQLAAILPQQIEVTTNSATPQLQSGETALFNIQANWLYGAPASGQNGYVNWTIQADNNAIPAWQEWQIGLFDEKVNARSQHDNLPLTNQQGLAQFSLPLNNLPRSSKPLSLTLRSAVFEPNGQEVNSQLQAPIQRTQPYLALKVNDRVAQAALINDRGESLSGKIDWKLYRVHYNWYWSNNNGVWQYHVNENRSLSTQGSLNADATTPSSFDLPINDGSWVLEVQGQDPLTAASLPIEYGNWTQPSVNNAPDSISISSDKVRYQDGDRVKVRLRAPFDGPLSVKLANGKILDNHQLNFKNGEAELDFKWREEWSQGIWLLANAWNQAPAANQNLRAVGLHWLGNDLEEINLDLQLALPAEVLPNQKISLPVKLNHAPQQTSWVQVAVVDEGLYQLAKASFSDPQQAFYGKKQLGLEMFDVWGSVIKQLKARQAAIRSGADGDESAELGNIALPELDIDLLTFWSKPVQLDAQNSAQIDLELPQFNGKLRVMAVAWNAEQIGSAEQTLIVKEPLVSQLNTPLFLSRDDQSEMKVRLHNTTDQPLQLNVEMRANQLLQFNDNKQQQVIKLQPQQEITLNRTFQAAENGKAQFEVRISGDIDKLLQRSADIRNPVLPFSRLSLAQLNGGASWQSPTFDPAQGALQAQQLTLSNRAPFDPQQTLDYLSSYPYGCVEQTASASWNNLLLDNLILGYDLPEADYPDQAQRKNNLNRAQLRLANLQASDGSFSLWGNDEQSDLWLSAYVADFLFSAQPQLAQQSSLNRVLDYLYQTVNRADYTELKPATADTTGYAYALYMLAKSGESVQGALLRALPIVASGSEIYPARLFILNGLLQQGEVSNVAEQLAKIAQNPRAVSFGYANYGDTLRDHANSMVLLYELKQQAEKLNLSDSQLLQHLDQAASAVWQALLSELKTTHYLNTQSAHWLAKLATWLPQSTQAASIEVNGKTVTVDGLQTLTLNDSPNIQLNNRGANPVFVSLNQWVQPTAATSVANGYQLDTRFLDLQGKPLDPNALKLNQHLLLEFSLKKTADAPQTDAEMMLVYSLPAGFKVAENMPFAYIDDGDESEGLIPHFTENRDDRHLAAFTFDKAQTKVVHRLVVRAAQVGSWQAPATTLENMYQPQYRAVQPASGVTIQP